MILITGANGNLGRRLIGQLAASDAAAGPGRIRAVVRSERAARAVIADDLPRVDVRVVDYLDQAAMNEAARGCSHIVHLVGIIRESASSTFEMAHEATTRVVVGAAQAAGARRIAYLSILGSSVDSANSCLASKGRAEKILDAAGVSTLILRVPMVLGEGDYASRALYHRARSAVSVQFRAASLEQPIYAGDVLAAILAGVGGPEDGGGCEGSFDLAGPESLSRADLTRRAAQVMGVPAPRILSLPVGFGLAVAGLLERVSARPPVTRAMLGVLDHDDHIDPGPALSALGIRLTPLNEALRRCLVDSPPS